MPDVVEQGDEWQGVKDKNQGGKKPSQHEGDPMTGNGIMKLAGHGLALCRRCSR